MPVSQLKLKKIESLATWLKTEPDTLIEALISIGFEQSEQLQIIKQGELKQLIPEQKVKVIEEEALNKGWTYEQLWRKHPRYDLRGLVCFVDNETTIGEVNEKYIALIHENSKVINRFYNMKVEQPWIEKVNP